MNRIAVLLSGGVDSSVALLRLLEAGERDVTAFYLKVWLEEELHGLAECPWQEDLAHARTVCAEAGVPLEVVPLQREYRERVVAYALDELRAGRTPSPDVLCNRRIKLGAFLEAAGGELGAVATGHYARTVETPQGRRLARSADPVKDQTYFLSQLTAGQLARCRFPVGDLAKTEVRRLARRWGLATAERPDSQGICFLGEIPFDAFVRFHLGERPGEIREAGSGRVLGEHRGHWFYTLGQRKGLGLSGGPWFVVEKELATDTVWVVHADELAGRAPDRFRVPAPHWIAGRPPAGLAAPPERCHPLFRPLFRDLRVKVRHGPASPACRVEIGGDGGLAVCLEAPDPGLAPGQFAVFYDGDVCLGGGAMEPVPVLRRGRPSTPATGRRGRAGSPPPR
jgi:tRNA-specific 2-thiouridylase